MFHQRILIIFSLFLFISHGYSRILQVGPDKNFKKPSEAAAACANGDTIEIDAGEYAGDATAWYKDNLVIRGVGGRAHLKASGAYVLGKGIWVTEGKNTTIENIEFSEASVPDENGAGIRADGPGLIIRNCYFHDNEEGILGPDAGEILIEYCEFSHNGFGDGYTHNMYIGNCEKFTLRFCYSHHAKIGHNVKSRANENYILYNRIMDESDGTSSYDIDLPNGGLSYIIGNIIQQGPNTDNSTIIAYGAEGLSNPNKSVYIVNNTIINDRNSGTFISIAGGSAAKIINNIFVHNGTILSGKADMISNLTSSGNDLVDVDHYDYHLVSTSDAINGGSDPGSGSDYDLTPKYQYVHPAGAESRVIDGVIDIGAFEYQTASSVAENNKMPESFSIKQNYPNPFNPSTTIEYNLSKDVNVELFIFNTLGQPIKKLVKQKQPAGDYKVQWNGSNEQDISVPSGIYMCKITAGAFSKSLKMIMIK